MSVLSLNYSLFFYYIYKYFSIPIFVNDDDIYTDTLFFSYCIIVEYAYTLRVDEKSDVYSFGVVLLELLTGRRPVGDFEDGVVDIAQWCKRALTNGENENDIICIVDKRIGMVPKEEAKHLFFIAMLCVQENSVERPTMREVVQMLAEFSHQFPQSPSSSSPYQNLKNGEKEREDPSKSKLDLLV